ncbi:hypothetical protein BU24DRAFT_498064 [Aaosphaeria arxii CBS 175.79]|uniref:Uncharacterized protein n=1 Tax=Aaosphaeria arxii CBS 175.79 TaxID=1450172 RepID=A0A6A5X5N5_9PLEO|nr:uncharacterized protein BU24DRAFT_498064 [Aaosphaeria arxii CBS 175.79]KAF2008305.1 hypothetical protein BU24DRAFT_498064 [Aaosphaeria arxii CBS 175.79]
MSHADSVPYLAHYFLGILPRVTPSVFPETILRRRPFAPQAASMPPTYLAGRPPQGKHGLPGESPPDRKQFRETLQNLKRSDGAAEWLEEEILAVMGDRLMRRGATAPHTASYKPSIQVLKRPPAVQSTPTTQSRTPVQRRVKEQSRTTQCLPGTADNPVTVRDTSGSPTPVMTPNSTARVHGMGSSTINLPRKAHDDLAAFGSIARQPTASTPVTTTQKGKRTGEDQGGREGGDAAFARLQHRWTGTYRVMTGSR